MILFPQGAWQEIGEWQACLCVRQKLGRLSQVVGLQGTQQEAEVLGPSQSIVDTSPSNVQMLVFPLDLARHKASSVRRGTRKGSADHRGDTESSSGSAGGAQASPRPDTGQWFPGPAHNRMHHVGRAGPEVWGCRDPWEHGSWKPWGILGMQELTHPESWPRLTL